MGSKSGFESQARAGWMLPPTAAPYSFPERPLAPIAPAGVPAVATRWIEVNDLMQRNYRYKLVAGSGRGFHPDFKPELTPRQMLELGVFGGRYMTDCADEFPASWFRNAQLCPERHDPELNFFGINASQPLAYWRAKGWIYHEDPRGWFQWYCRYYLGRRCPDDERQIRRWIAFRRHIGQVRAHCRKGDFSCRRRQRQALLHWAYDSRRL